MTAQTTILPPNATALERGLDAVAAARVAGVAIPLSSLWSAAQCPEANLPWLAKTVGLRSWNPAMPLALRRARVANAMTIHRQEGTVQSVRDVIASYGGIVALSEWWELVPRGIPRTFSLQITLGGQTDAPSADFITSVIADVNGTKPKGSFFTFTVALNATAAIGLAAAARPAAFARLTCHEA